MKMMPHLADKILGTAQFTNVHTCKIVDVVYYFPITYSKTAGNLSYIQ